MVAYEGKYLKCRLSKIVRKTKKISLVVVIDA